MIIYWTITSFQWLYKKYWARLRCHLWPCHLSEHMFQSQLLCIQSGSMITCLAQELQSLPFGWGTWIGFWPLVLAWRSPGLCNHVANEPINIRFWSQFPSLPIILSFKLIKADLQKKIVDQKMKILSHCWQESHLIENLHVDSNNSINQTALNINNGAKILWKL